MNRLHPNFLKAILSQLPEGTVIVEAKQGDDSLVLVNDKGVELVVPKTDMGTYLKGQEISVRHQPEWTVNELLEDFSRRYGLYWVQGVDYESDDRLVSELGGGLFQWEAPSSSLIWKGRVEIRVFPGTNGVKPNDVITIPLQRHRAQQAVIQQIITGKGKLLTDKKLLTAVVVKALHAKLTECGETDIHIEHLQKAEVLKVFSDRYSSLALIKLEKYGSLFFRFDLEKDNPKEPDPI